MPVGHGPGQVQPQRPAVRLRVGVRVHRQHRVPGRDAVTDRGQQLLDGGRVVGGVREVAQPDPLQRPPEQLGEPRAGPQHQSVGAQHEQGQARHRRGPGSRLLGHRLCLPLPRCAATPDAESDSTHAGAAT